MYFMYLLCIFMIWQITWGLREQKRDLWVNRKWQNVFEKTEKLQILIELSPEESLNTFDLKVFSLQSFKIFTIFMFVFQVLSAAFLHCNAIFSEKAFQCFLKQWNDRKSFKKSSFLLPLSVSAVTASSSRDLSSICLLHASSLLAFLRVSFTERVDWVLGFSSFQWRFFLRSCLKFFDF